MTPDWCGLCLGHDESDSQHPTSSARFAGRTKQDALNDLCDITGSPRQLVGEGSSLPSNVFKVAAVKAGVPTTGSMPEIAEAIVKKAGLTWGPDCDSRGSTSGGGSTVTLAVMDILIRALGQTP